MQILAITEISESFPDIAVTNNKNIFKQHLYVGVGRVGICIFYI
jgi:hypothetical protein